MQERALPVSNGPLAPLQPLGGDAALREEQLATLLTGLAGSGLLQALCTAFSAAATSQRPISASTLEASEVLWSYIIAPAMWDMLLLLAHPSGPQAQGLVVTLFAAPEVQRLLRFGLERLAQDGGVVAPAAVSRDAEDGLTASGGLDAHVYSAESLRRDLTFVGHLRSVHYSVLSTAAAVWDRAFELGVYGSPMPAPVQLPRLFARALEALHRLRRGEGPGGLYGEHPAADGAQVHTLVNAVRRAGSLLARVSSQLKAEPALAAASRLDQWDCGAWGLAVLVDAAQAGPREGRAGQERGADAAAVGEAELVEAVVSALDVMKMSSLGTEGTYSETALLCGVCDLLKHSQLLRRLDAALRLLLRAGATSGASWIRDVVSRLTSPLVVTTLGERRSASLGLYVTLSKVVRARGTRLQARLAEGAAAASSDSAGSEALEVQAWSSAVASLFRGVAPHALMPVEQEVPRSPRHVDPFPPSDIALAASMTPSRDPEVRAVVLLAAQCCLRAAVPVLQCCALRESGQPRCADVNEWTSKWACLSVHLRPVPEALGRMLRWMPAEALAPAAPLALLAACGRALHALWSRKTVAGPADVTTLGYDALYIPYMLAMALAHAACHESLSAEVRAALCAASRGDGAVAAMDAAAAVGNGSSGGAVSGSTGGGSTAPAQPDAATDTGARAAAEPRAQAGGAAPAAPTPAPTDFGPLLVVLPSMQPPLLQPLERLVRAAAGGCGDSAFRRQAEQVALALDEQAAEANPLSNVKTFRVRRAEASRRAKGGGGSEEASEDGEKAVVRICGNPGCERFEGPCEADAVRSKRCGGCRVVRYCCTDCQREHWRGGHRQECRPLG